ncbi:MAG: DUF3795 domain-containing protein [Spirochaetes bacterium]|nr:MAG: DUF3795 domain-containing protein [Spirochaetota bacterium]
MNEFKLESYCGIYCGACEIMAAYRKGIAENREAAWGDVPPPMNGMLPPARPICHGCKTDTVFDGCARCPIRACAKQRGIAESCVTCADFPCALYRGFRESSEIAALVEKLPHLKSTIKNLKAIRDRGMGQWLAEQELLWKCPACGAPYSWYKTACAGCGKDLEPLKDYNTLCKEDLEI